MKNIEDHVIAVFDTGRPVSFVKDDIYAGIVMVDNVQDAKTFPTAKAANKFLTKNIDKLSHCIITKVKYCL